MPPSSKSTINGSRIIDQSCGSRTGESIYWLADGTAWRTKHPWEDGSATGQTVRPIVHPNGDKE